MVSVDYPHIAVLVPCYNEEVAILIVVCDFHEVLPNATIYVYDNNSQDRTIELARAAGAVVGTETLQGKGNVVRPCSPISRPTCIFSSTATIPTMLPWHRGLFLVCLITNSTWSMRGG